MIKLVNKSVSDLIPYIRNPKKHPEKQVAELAASIIEFDFIQPILIYSNNEIIAGHGRLLAAQKVGMDQVPCLIADHLTPQQVKAFRLIDNRVAQNSEWDREMMSLEMEEIGGQFQFESYGFGIEELEALNRFSGSIDDLQDLNQDQPDSGEGLKGNVNNVKQFQVYFDKDELEKFQMMLGSLREKWALPDASQAVFRAVEECHTRSLESEKPDDKIKDEPGPKSKPSKKVR